MRIARPTEQDYGPFYRRYVDRCVQGDILAELATQTATAESLLRPLDEQAALFRYAPGKWSRKQVIGHLIDTERLFVYRATSIARGDPAPLPGMDQDRWLAGADFDRTSLGDLLDEFILLRRTTVLFFRRLRPQDLARRGQADGQSLTVLALPYIIAGHSSHHLKVMQERYR
jgi:hypothetical protein